MSVTFGMMSGGEMKLHVQSSPERPEEMGNKFHTAVGSDMAQDTAWRRCE